MGRDCTDPQRPAGAGLQPRTAGYRGGPDTDLEGRVATVRGCGVDRCSDVLS